MAAQLWEESQQWERKWHGSCANTYGEEMKQLAYAKRMGLATFHDGKSPFNIDMGGASVLDVGGGPVSLLLKCHNLGKAVVIDPCHYPPWVHARYRAAGILLVKRQAERIAETLSFDLVLCYNVLQHTANPKRIVHKMRQISHELRLFEWIDTGTSAGHPHNLTEEQLNAWLGGEGKTEELKGEANCWGRCYYGIFKGDLF